MSRSEQLEYFTVLASELRGRDPAAFEAELERMRSLLSEARAAQPSPRPRRRRTRCA